MVILQTRQLCQMVGQSDHLIGQCTGIAFVVQKQFQYGFPAEIGAMAASVCDESFGDREHGFKYQMAFKVFSGHCGIFRVFVGQSTPQQGNLKENAFDASARVEQMPAGFAGLGS